MQADVEHAGREQAGIVDAHGVHPAIAELDVAVPIGLELFGGAQRISGDAPADILVADLLRHQRAAAALHALRRRELTQDVVLHEGQNVLHVLVLVVMGVDVDDDHVVEFALMGLLTGVGKESCGVQLVNRHAAAAIGRKFHRVSPETSLPTLQICCCDPADQRPVQLCHMPSSKTARLAAFSKPLAATMTSVEVTWLRAASGGKLPLASTCAE